MSETNSAAPVNPSTAERRAAFLAWLDQWYAQLPDASLPAVIQEAGAENVAVLVVDLLIGFCSEGPLASPRVGALGPLAATFLQQAWDAGVRHVLFASDSHPEDSPEFRSFPPHCIRGTREAEVIPELTQLPFFEQTVQIEKRSLSVGVETVLGAWQDRFPAVKTWIILGDCTDLCVYNAAMHFRLQANARGTEVDVIVPADLVDTYDLPVDVAQTFGALPHDGDLLHRVFLYHLALNGVRVVGALKP